jgi:hypothetical protein
MAEKNSLWKNIRKKAEQNRRTGAKPKKPTAEMLRQEKKIKAKQYFKGGPTDPTDGDFKKSSQATTDFFTQWYKGRAMNPKFTDVANKRLELLNSNIYPKTEILPYDKMSKEGFYDPTNNIIKYSDKDLNDRYYNDNINSLITHETDHYLSNKAPQEFINANSIIDNNVKQNKKWLAGENDLHQDEEIRARLSVWRQLNNIDPTKDYSLKELRSIINKNLDDENLDNDIKDLYESIKFDAEKLKYFNDSFVSNPQSTSYNQYAAQGGYMYPDGGDIPPISIRDYLKVYRTALKNNEILSNRKDYSKVTDREEYNKRKANIKNYLDYLENSRYEAINTYQLPAHINTQKEYKDLINIDYPTYLKNYSLSDSIKNNFSENLSKEDFEKQLNDIKTHYNQSYWAKPEDYYKEDSPNTFYQRELNWMNMNPELPISFYDKRIVPHDYVEYKSNVGTDVYGTYLYDPIQVKKEAMSAYPQAKEGEYKIYQISGGAGTTGNSYDYQVWLPGQGWKSYNKNDFDKLYNENFLIQNENSLPYEGNELNTNYKDQKAKGGYLYPDGGKTKSLVQPPVLLDDNIIYLTDYPLLPGLNKDIIDARYNQYDKLRREFIHDEGMTPEEYYQMYPTKQEFERKTFDPSNRGVQLANGGLTGDDEDGRKTKVYTDINKFREAEKAYNDSLMLSTRFPMPPKGYDITPYVFNKNATEVIGRDRSGREIVRNVENKRKIQPIGNTSHNARRLTSSNTYNVSTGKSGEIISTKRPIYKSPEVKPIYIPPLEYLKPITFKAFETNEEPIKLKPIEMPFFPSKVFLREMGDLDRNRPRGEKKLPELYMDDGKGWRPIDFNEYKMYKEQYPGADKPGGWIKNNKANGGYMYANGGGPGDDETPKISLEDYLRLYEEALKTEMLMKSNPDYVKARSYTNTKDFLDELKDSKIRYNNMINDPEYISKKWSYVDKLKKGKPEGMSDEDWESEKSFLEKLVQSKYNDETNKSYYNELDSYRFYQRDLLNNTINPDLPPIYYDRRVTPHNINWYNSTKTYEHDSYPGEVVNDAYNYYTYDPIKLEEEIGIKYPTSKNPIDEIKKKYNLITDNNNVTNTNTTTTNTPPPAVSKPTGIYSNSSSGNYYYIHTDDNNKTMRIDSSELPSYFDKYDLQYRSSDTGSSNNVPTNSLLMWDPNLPVGEYIDPNKPDYYHYYNTPNAQFHPKINTEGFKFIKATGGYMYDGGGNFTSDGDKDGKKGLFNKNVAKIGDDKNTLIASSLSEVDVSEEKPDWLKDKESKQPDYIDWYESFNPKKWGLNDYSNYSSFSSAFRNAREAGENEFVYNTNRYNTKLKSDNEQNIIPTEDSYERQPEIINLVDKRKYNPVTKGPINPNRDLVSGQFEDPIINEIIISSYKRDVDPYTALAIGLQESRWGQTDSNIGHVSSDSEDYAPGVDEMVSFIKEKEKYAKKLGYKDKKHFIQAYNGLGNVYPETEQDYHGFKMKSIYGVPVPKEGINLAENPLYGEKIINLEDSVLKQNPEIVKRVEYYKPKATGGYTNPYMYYAGGPMYYGDGGKVWKHIGAGAYALGEGLLDTLTMGATDQLTDKGYYALQKLGNKNLDLSDPKVQKYIKTQDQIKGYGNAAAAITTGIFTGNVKGATTQTAKGLNTAFQASDWATDDFKKWSNIANTAIGMGVGLSGKSLSSGNIDSELGKAASEFGAKASKYAPYANQAMGMFGGSNNNQTLLQQVQEREEYLNSPEYLAMKEQQNQAYVNQGLSFASQGGNINNNLVNLQTDSMKNRYNDYRKKYKTGGKLEGYGIKKVSSRVGLHKNHPNNGMQLGPDALVEGEELIRYAEGGMMGLQGPEYIYPAHANGEKNIKMPQLDSNYKIITDKYGMPRFTNKSPAQWLEEKLNRGSEFRTEVDNIGKQSGDQAMLHAEGGREISVSVNQLKEQLAQEDAMRIAQEDAVAAYGGYMPKNKNLNMPNSYAKGGGIHIKESKKGTFTAAAKKHGMGVQEFARKVLANKGKYSSAMVKKANFARNAAKWKHAEGGPLEEEYEIKPTNNLERYKQLLEAYDKYRNYDFKGEDVSGNLGDQLMRIIRNEYPELYNYNAQNNEDLARYIYNNEPALFPSLVSNEFSNTFPTREEFFKQRDLTAELDDQEAFQKGMYYRKGRLDYNTLESKNKGTYEDRGTYYQSPVTGDIIYKSNYVKPYEFGQGGPMVSNVPQPFSGPSAQNRGGMMIQYAMGGMMQQSGQEDQMMQMMQQVQEMLMQGANPQELLKQLMKSGLPQDQAQQLVQAAMQDLQSQQTQMAMGGKMYGVGTPPEGIQKGEAWYDEPGYSKFARYSQALPGVAATVTGMQNKSRKLTPTFAKDITVNYEPERIADREESRRKFDVYKNMLKNVANSSGMFGDNARLGFLNYNKDLANRISQSIMREKNTKAQLEQQTNLANTQIANTFKEKNEEIFQNAQTQALLGAQDTTSKLAGVATDERKQYLQEWIAKNRLKTRNIVTGPTGQDYFYNPATKKYTDMNTGETYDILPTLKE